MLRIDFHLPHSFLHRNNFERIAISLIDSVRIPFCTETFTMSPHMRHLHKQSYLRLARDKPSVILQGHTYSEQIQRFKRTSD